MEKTKVDTPNTTVDILELRNQAVGQYRSYAESFLNVRDEDLRTRARQMLDSGELWPDPLLHCNPGFEKGESVKELVETHNLLHPEVNHIFKGFQLHKHQAEAIKLGANGKGFIVTSGTGSGKSLTYLGTIFNAILQRPEEQRKGVKAIIVYPMNALINSQEQEIEKFEKRYKEETGKDFPITFSQYTGQTKGGKKKSIIENPPNIILTNYMMLELLLTRSKEAELRDSIFKSLEYLAFDELHWYRGRQGADVAMLIRRIKASTQKPLVCMGTSATLSSGTLEEQKTEIALLGKQLFDQEFAHHQIIGESLVSKTPHLPSGRELAESLAEPLKNANSFDYLLEHPLSGWMEHKIALADNQGDTVRGEPLTIQEITKKLCEQTGLSLEKCEQRLQEFLKLLQKVNQEQDVEFLPFRIHQFIRQTGALKVTLQSEGIRKVSTSDELYSYEDNRKMPLFPVVFNRQSGATYLRVQKAAKELLPWDGESETEGYTNGYLVFDSDNEPLWSQARAQELLPDHWCETLKTKEWRVKKDKKDFLPESIYVKATGEFYEAAKKDSLRAWFIKAPLHIDPFSGTVYQGQTKENTKMAQLGDAGRSISTTILTHSVLKQLRGQKASERIQKVMSFTDNRQDAALQAGHFNDFTQQAFLRAAVYWAMVKHEESKKSEPKTTPEYLDYSNIASAVFEQMQLKQEDYAAQVSESTWKIRKAEAAFKNWLTYQLFYDLRRSWRHRLPNLEQCGLLIIHYRELENEAANDSNWQSSDFLSALDPSARYTFLVQFLNYIRTTFAIDHNKLWRTSIETAKNQMREQLKEGWFYQESDELPEPNWMRVDSKRYKTHYTQSIGPASAVGTYMKFFAKKHGRPIEHKELETQIMAILECLVSTGYLMKNEDSLYRLELGRIEWRLGDGKTLVLDEVRNRSLLDREGTVEPNSYFKKLYQQKPGTLKDLLAREHTGQIAAKERIEIEGDFRAAKIRALYCSPTMELGIDIDELCVVHMRNVPPNPAHYAQRSGRAGRKGQGALILTFCSENSPHDQHFFQHKKELVSGKVNTQKLDLTNQDLLRSHLQAVYLSACHIEGMNRSMADVLDIENKELPLLPNIANGLDLEPEEVSKLSQYFHEVIEGLKPELEQTEWFGATWVEDQLAEVPTRFNQAATRWRELYVDAQQSKESATIRINQAHLSKSSPEWVLADSIVHQSQRKLDLLRNKGHKTEFSEFYPYRYFASEGFLPGYNFTRLPIRLYLDGGKSGGNYLSRPRHLAITEFGPENIVYHAGTKWKVRQMRLPPSKGELACEKASIDRDSGFFNRSNQMRNDRNILSQNGRGDTIGNLLKLQDMIGARQEKISCHEDERIKKGFELQLLFTYAGDLSRTRKLSITQQGDKLLSLHYLPNADLVYINRKWKKSRNEEGFRLHSQNGYWKNETQYKEATDEEKDLIKNRRLYTTVTTNCLYIEPLRNLQLKKNGVITLLQAFKKAIEIIYQVEADELGAIAMGSEDHPNILFYENTEGSLGVLSSLVSSETAFKEVIQKAIQVCQFHNNVNQPATYSDLLSYHNQRHHRQIDRSLIRRTLDQLNSPSVNFQVSNSPETIRQHYLQMRAELGDDNTNAIELLDYLYSQKIRLPDLHHYQPHDCAEIFDFFYLPSTGIQLQQSPKKVPKINGLLSAAHLGIRVLQPEPNESTTAFVKAHTDPFTSFQS